METDATYFLRNFKGSTPVGKQHQEIIHEALEAFHRERMLDDINAAFAQLKRDDSAWREEQAERTAWEGGAADGVPSE